MKKNVIGAGFAVLTGVVLATPSASAWDMYPDKIPNGRANECRTCHIDSDPLSSGITTRNPFGLDVAAHKTGLLVGATIHWDELWHLDSDGDGQTNGQELGDPCGQWTVGATPERTTDISLPGFPDSTSADPGTACEPGGGDEDAGPTPGDDAGAEPGDEDAGSEPDPEPADDAGTGGGDEPPGCSSTGVNGGAPVGALALLGLGLLARRRRR